jgi:hypothetical protein
LTLYILAFIEKSNKGSTIMIEPTGKMRELLWKISGEQP